MRTCGYTNVTMECAKLDVRPVSRFLRALADDTRLRIIALLSHGELCVCHIQDALDLPQPNISRQLGTLRAAGIVEDRRDGSWVYYRLLPQANPNCARQLQSLVQGFATDRTLRRDVQRLLKARGPGACK